MVRVSGLIEQFEAGILQTSPDGLSPAEQLRSISKGAKPLRKQAADVWAKELKPELAKEGIIIRSVNELNEKQKNFIGTLFQSEIFPLCTPLVLHPATNLPFISNRSLNIVVELEDDTTELRLARVKVPTVVPRAIKLPGKGYEFVLLEDLIAANLASLFPGVGIKGSYLFRVIRDADIEIRELDAADLIASLEETLRLRRFGDPVLLEVQAKTPDRIKRMLMRLLELDKIDLFEVPGLIGYEVLWELARIDKPSLRFPVHIPYIAEPLATSDALFEAISEQDILVHQPYDSFRSVEEFIGAAATDSSVIGIKQTLYRVGSESRIVEALSHAAEAGKQVAAMVELKARFDESNNLVWSRALERAGVHVTFGFSEMKTHCKLSLIVRREGDSIKQYAHIGTGNYNPVTARLYTDLGLFTVDPELTQDISELFNYLTGFSKQSSYRKLLVAPVNLREGVLDLIHKETESHKTQGRGRIILKLNAIVDPEAIEALYEASCAGVRVDLIVRGVCCVRPGVPGMSENIRVVSIVGRFLEHSRVYYFENNGKPKVLIGSADLMRRNLDRRVEVLAPVQQANLVALIHQILETCLIDNSQSWDLDSHGNYVRRRRKTGKSIKCQSEFMLSPATLSQFSRGTISGEEE